MLVVVSVSALGSVRAYEAERNGAVIKLMLSPINPIMVNSLIEGLLFSISFGTR